MRGKRERHKKRARSFIQDLQTSSLCLSLASSGVFLCWSEKAPRGHRALYSLGGSEGSGVIQMQASGSLVPCLLIEQKRAAHSSIPEPLGKGCQWSQHMNIKESSLCRWTVTVRSHLLDFWLAFEADGYKDVDEFEKRQRAQLGWIQQISLAILSISDRSEFTDLPYHLYYGANNFLFSTRKLPCCGFDFSSQKAGEKI